MMELHTVCNSENRSDLHGPGSCSEQRGSRRNGILVVVVDNSFVGVVRMGSRLRLSGGMGDPRTGTLVRKDHFKFLMIHMKRIARKKKQIVCWMKKNAPQKYEMVTHGRPLRLQSLF